MLSAVLVVNGMMMWGNAVPFAYKDEKLTSRILFYVCAVLFVGLDGWIYHRLFRKAEQKDLLNNAITCIAKVIPVSGWTQKAYRKRKNSRRSY